MIEVFCLFGSAMPDLSVLQYNAVDNIFSMTVATMGAAALFLYMARSHVDPEYRPALLVSGTKHRRPHEDERLTKTSCL